MPFGLERLENPAKNEQHQTTTPGLANSSEPPSFFFARGFHETQKLFTFSRGCSSLLADQKTDRSVYRTLALLNKAVARFAQPTDPLPTRGLSGSGVASSDGASLALGSKLRSGFDRREAPVSLLGPPARCPFTLFRGRVPLLK